MFTVPDPRREGKRLSTLPFVSSIKRRLQEIKETGVDKEKYFIQNLTLFFGIFLLCTDVFFLIMGIVYDMPLMRYVIYVKLIVNSVNLVLILRQHYMISTVIIYAVILVFMVTGVVCAGMSSAFQLYALGMLTCVSYNSYLHKRILKKDLPFFLIVAIHVIAYAGVYIYGRTHAPLYNIPRSAETIFLVFNSVASFYIVVLYVWLYRYVAIDSEEQLERMALVDNLTGLYNRHYLLAHIDNKGRESLEGCWLALLDIDDFKKINDTHGHNCGDHVLHKIADMTQETCEGCIVCRWGGEEFIILSDKAGYDDNHLDALKNKIESEVFNFEDKELHITVTIGVSGYDSSLNHDAWISSADEKLYYGKKHGKNQVVRSIQ